MTYPLMREPKNLIVWLSSPVIPKRYQDDFLSYDEYKISSKDSLVSLAEKANERTGASWTWYDVAKYNWGTDQPKEVNWYLYHIVGCRKTGRKGNLMFSDDDEPGIIYLPTRLQIQKESSVVNKRKTCRGKMATRTEGVNKPKKINRYKPRPREVLLFDTKSGRLYKVPIAMYIKMIKYNGMLEKIRKDIKAANDRGRDEKKNAELMGKDVLEEYCEVTTPEKPDYSSGVPKADPNKTTVIREFVDLHSKKFIYVPDKKMEKIESKIDKKDLKDVIKVEQSDFLKNFLDKWKKDESLNSKDLKKKWEEERKKGKMPFEIKFDSGWKVAGEDSLLNLIDSADPRQMAVLTSNPATAPLALVDWVSEKYPGFFREKHKGDFWKKSNYFEGSAEASFLRYSYGAQWPSAIFDPKNLKFQVGCKAGGSLDLFKGKLTSKIFLPHKWGYKLHNIFNIKDDYKHKNNLKIYVTITGEISGFVGAKAELGLEATVDAVSADEKYDATGKKKARYLDIGVGGGIEAFAGASATAQGIFAVEWYNIDEKKPKLLASVSGQATGIAGIAGIFKFNIGYDKDRKKYTFEFKAGLAFKVGGSTGYKGDLDAIEVIYFISALIEAVDYEKLLDTITTAAFEKHKEWLIALLICPPAAIATLTTIAAIDYYAKWMEERKIILELANRIVKNPNHHSIKHGTPEAKAEMINRLCESSWILSNELQEKAVLKLLKSCKTKRAMENTLQRVIAKGAREEGVKKWGVEKGIDEVTDLLDGPQQTEFIGMLKKFNIKYS